MKALDEESGYEELILYPPPLNYITIPLIILSPSEETINKYSAIFQNVYFWIENFFLIIGYFLYFLCLSPIIWIRLVI